MTLFYEEEGALKLPFDCQALAREVINGALEYIHCPYEVQVNLLLTMNDEIHEMNRDFRNIDRATDVHFFSRCWNMKLRETSLILKAEEDCFDPETGELLLGDIVISKEKVIAQAEEYGHSVKREYAFLIAHSVLHLSGYDHMEEEERIEMETLQREILNELNILR